MNFILVAIVLLVSASAHATNVPVTVLCSPNGPAYEGVVKIDLDLSKWDLDSKSCKKVISREVTADYVADIFAPHPVFISFNHLTYESSSLYASLMKGRAFFFKKPKDGFKCNLSQMSQFQHSLWGPTGWIEPKSGYKASGKVEFENANPSSVSGNVGDCIFKAGKPSQVLRGQNLSTVYRQEMKKRR